MDQQNPAAFTLLQHVVCAPQQQQQQQQQQLFHPLDSHQQQHHLQQQQPQQQQQHHLQQQQPQQQQQHHVLQQQQPQQQQQQLFFVPPVQHMYQQQQQQSFAPQQQFQLFVGDQQPQAVQGGPPLGLQQQPMYMSAPPPIAVVQTPNGPAVVQQDLATGMWILQAPPSGTVLVPSGIPMQPQPHHQLQQPPPSQFQPTPSPIAPRTAARASPIGEHVQLSPSAAGSRSVSFQQRGHMRSLSDNSTGGGGGPGGVAPQFSNSGGAMGTPQLYNRHNRHHRRQSSTTSEQSFMELQQHFSATGGVQSTPGVSSSTPIRSGAESGSRPGSVENARPHHGNNVHGSLQGKCMFFSFPPNFMVPSELGVEQHQVRHRDMGTASVPLFCQMFPIEYVPFAGKVLQFVCDSVCGAGTVSSIRDISAKSEKSFTAHFYTDNVWEVVSRLRRRVLMDRHGFWYADDFQQYTTMRAYCESVRKLPQHTRHFLTDGLPCMPLVIEVCRGVNLALLPPPLPHQQCFDEIELIGQEEQQ